MNDALCERIRNAFSGVKLGKGVGLHKAQGLDDYDDAATRARYRASDEKEDWRRIPAAELNRCNSSLSFFDAEGMRFHLPVFLIAELQGLYVHELVFTLTYPPSLTDGTCFVVPGSAGCGPGIPAAHRRKRRSSQGSQVRPRWLLG